MSRRPDRRTWLFRVGAVALGLLPLLVIEVGLALVGRGYVDQLATVQQLRNEASHLYRSNMSRAVRLIEQVSRRAASVSWWDISYSASP